MLDELPGNELANVAGTDDDDVLHVRVAAAGDRPGAGPRERDEENAERPEGDELGEVRLGETGHRRAREEEPGTGRQEPEDADEVVDRRVVGTLLVVVVELVELRDHDPERQRGDEQEDLDPDAHRAGSRIEAERDLGRDERQHEPQYIGEDQEPDDEPPARALGRAREDLLERLQRACRDAVVSSGNRVESGHRR